MVSGTTTITRRPAPVWAAAAVPGNLSHQQCRPAEGQHRLDQLAPGDEWFPAEPTGAYLRINYSGPNPGAFADGARVLGRTPARQHPGRRPAGGADR